VGGRADDTLPDRILNEVREDGWPGIELEKMLCRYYKLRGWDKNGLPEGSYKLKKEF
jgi:aldehyde:ferredoxin oxidoreductase